MILQSFTRTQCTLSAPPKNPVIEPEYKPHNLKKLCNRLLRYVLWLLPSFVRLRNLSMLLQRLQVQSFEQSITWFRENRFTNGYAQTAITTGLWKLLYFAILQHGNPELPKGWRCLYNILFRASIICLQREDWQP